jgi:CheY-like chemotaxis protein
MTIGLLFIFIVLCVVVDLALRAVLQRVRAARQLREREQALAVSLQLDFTREAKSLKRVEVNDPAARILCVDDEAIILDSFRRILVLDGYSIDTVETGQEALGLIQARHYDFVFTDLRMPAMDGVEVVKAVKHMRPDIDVIIVTGYASVETAVECMKHGAMDYVQKPFTEEELRAFVKKVLIKRTARIEQQLKPQIHITHLAGADNGRAGEFAIPGGVLISGGHCWVSVAEDGGARVGLDDFARKVIGKIDGLELPNVGMTVQVGQPLRTKPMHFIREIITLFQSGSVQAPKALHPRAGGRGHPLPAPSPTATCTSGTPRPSASTSAWPRSSAAAATCAWTTPTRPRKTVEYVENIKKDVRWLGFDWGEHFYYSADYFERMYEVARDLIRKAKAYVCELTQEQWKEYRGVPTRPGKESPFRNRPAAESLDLFARMRAGEFPTAPCACAPRSTWPRPTCTCATRDLPHHARAPLPDRRHLGASTPCTTSPTRWRTRSRASPTPCARWSSRCTARSTTGWSSTSTCPSGRTSTSSPASTSPTP